MEENYEEAEVVNYRSLLENAPDALVLVAISGEIQYVNAQAEQLFGYPSADLVGRMVEILVPERYRPLHEQHRATYAMAPKLRPMGLHLTHLAGLRRDGSEFLAEINLAPLPGGSTVVAIRQRDAASRERVIEEREWQREQNRERERERQWQREKGREREREFKLRKPRVTTAVTIVVLAQIIFNLILYFLLAK